MSIKLTSSGDDHLLVLNTDSIIVMFPSGDETCIHTCFCMYRVKENIDQVFERMECVIHESRNT